MLTLETRTPSETRASARKQSLEMKWPLAASESWRRSPVNNFPLDEIFMKNFSRENAFQGERPDFEKLSRDMAEYETQAEDTVPQENVYRLFTWHDEIYMPRALPDGVEILSLNPEKDDYPAHLLKYIEQLVPFDRDRFTALNYANAPLILFMSIKEGMNIPGVVQVIHLSARKQLLSFPKTVIISGKDSRAFVVERFLSVPDGAINAGAPDLSADSQLNGLVSTTELIARDNSELNYYGLETMDHRTLSFFHLGGIIHKNARLDLGLCQLGSRWSRWDTSVNLASPGAYSHIHGFSLGSKNRHLDLLARQIHNAPKTTSQLTFKSALTQRSYATFSGLLVMEKEARGASANQVNKNILLGNKAKAHTTPKLEIKVDEVQCSHGATVSDIDRESIFYLLARGINERDAQRLIIEGFFEDVIHKTPITEMHRSLSSLMRKELDEAGV